LRRGPFRVDAPGAPARLIASTPLIAVPSAPESARLLRAGDGHWAIDHRGVWSGHGFGRGVRSAAAAGYPDPPFWGYGALLLVAAGRWGSAFHWPGTAWLRHGLHVRCLRDSAGLSRWSRLLYALSACPPFFPTRLLDATAVGRSVAFAARLSTKQDLGLTDGVVLEPRCSSGSLTASAATLCSRSVLRADR
jgi:hypothetical protein